MAVIEAAARHSQFLQCLQVFETLRVNSLDLIHVQVPEEVWMGSEAQQAFKSSKAKVNLKTSVNQAL
ncbi:hypothetical protein E2C01_024433 [Portunus trituberculatus]|uniref:Uncharacterized protein n=1 Tax=Portunus trituberculatus TaxID=210409 RepID=A0A5B7ECP6_PORTR|nr:hypothetical protein [Portunus trituberculatus]